MRQFKSSGHEQRFLSAFGIITSHFRVEDICTDLSGYRALMKSRFVVWEEMVGAQAELNTSNLINHMTRSGFILSELTMLFL